MRLPVDARFRILALLLTGALCGCGLIGGDRGDRLQPLAAFPSTTGPAADYPMVLGEPFTVAGKLYTPADTLNYDTVGYAVPDEQGGTGITAAHKTLPLPSYVEVTSLQSGKTILARVERRGPMSSALIALSPGAQTQLGVGANAPVRVRRVNPPEIERAELRAGRQAPERLETPKSLVEVLRRKLPENGVASLDGAVASAPAVERTAQPVQKVVVAPTLPVSTPAPASTAKLNADDFSKAFPVEPESVTSYPLPLLAAAPRITTADQSAKPALANEQPAAANSAEGFVIQAAAFSIKSNADRAAGKLGGFVSPAGKYYRVRTGPYATRGQAEAALAKVRAAGYSDAKVSTAG